MTHGHGYIPVVLHVKQKDLCMQSILYRKTSIKDRHVYHNHDHNNHNSL